MQGRSLGVKYTLLIFVMHFLKKETIRDPIGFLQRNGKEKSYSEFLADRTLVTPGEFM